QPPEAPLPQHVRERLPCLPPLEQRLQAVHLVVEPRREPGPRDAEEMRNEPFRVDPRRLHPCRGEPPLGLRERLPRGHSPSARRRSSVTSASVNSSSSPWRIRSSWCTVSLTRWSVTRLSGKLYVRIFSERSPDPIWERRVASSSARWRSSSRS